MMKEIMAVYRKSFKELLTFFVIFNLSFLILSFILDQIERFHDCVLQKIGKTFCHPSGITSYITSTMNSFWELWPALAGVANALFLPLSFLIYFPLLDYCQHKTAKKRIPYIICGALMGGLVFLSFYLMQKFPQSAQPTESILLIISGLILLIILPLLLSVVIFKTLAGLLKKAKA
jgi:hypothetical protein